jgi:hypothetical protein
MRGKIQIFLLAMVGFTACEEWSSPPTDFSANMKVYFTPARNEARKITLYGVCDTVLAIAGARYGGTQSPVGEVIASFAIGHDSLVAAYNAGNGTEYLPFPGGVVTLLQTTAAIPATTFASPAINVRLNDGERLVENKTYLLPILMTGVTGALPIDNDYTTAYVEVSRRPFGIWRHGDYRQLHAHTDGNGIPLVIIGDGFAATDLEKGGVYEVVCEQLSSKFLSNPIIRDFKDWFDVYMVVAESPESRIEPGDPDHHPGFFNSAVDVNFGMANEFTAAAVPGLAGKDTRSFIFVGHGMIGGYALFGNRDGMGWAVFSTDESEGATGYWMAHEFVGHGFAALADEYLTNGYGGPAEVQAFQADGMLMNVSYTDNPALVPWKDFIGREGYGEVGIYEGGYGEMTGIWRPEDWSIMMDNRFGSEGDEALYYTAMSRWILYQTIHRRAGKSYTFEKFLEYDKAYNVR